MLRNPNIKVNLYAVQKASKEIIPKRTSKQIPEVLTPELEGVIIKN
jgi:hypothetical protein